MIHKDSFENSNPVPGNGKLPSAAVGVLAIAPISDRVAPSSKSVPEWVDYVAPDFVQSNVSTIAGAKKLIEAKKALRKSKESFRSLVEALGMDLDKAERLMVIARHPVLSDSAHARNLPLSWMTQFTLAKIPAATLAQLIEDGSIHPGLERKQAERLVERTRARNSTNGVETVVDGHEDGGEPTPLTFAEILSLSDDDNCDDDRGGDDHDQLAATARDDVGSDSRCEIDRKLARLDELERERRQWEIQRSGYESEVQELQAKLGPEANLRHPRKLFRRALETLQKSDAPKLLEQDRRALVNSAVTDLVELIRSLARDGLTVERLDLFCRPEPH